MEIIQRIIDTLNDDSITSITLQITPEKGRDYVNVPQLPLKEIISLAATLSEGTAILLKTLQIAVEKVVTAKEFYELIEDVLKKDEEDTKSSPDEDKPTLDDNDDLMGFPGL